MVINNWGHSQSALAHYVYSLKDRDKVWQWSCPAHLRQWLADNLQETGAGAGVIKSSPQDKAADWPCSNHCCSLRCVCLSARLLLLPFARCGLSTLAGLKGDRRDVGAAPTGCRRGTRERRHRRLVPAAPHEAYGVGGPGGCRGASVAPGMEVCGQ